MISTFQFEDSIPRLPVPSLSETVKLVLSSLKPLVSTEDYEAIAEESGAFLDNEAIKLVQRHLEAAGKNSKQGCYLNAVTDDDTPGLYGDLRGNVLPRNPYLVLEEDPYSKTINPRDQAQRAACLINSSLKFFISLRRRTLKPDFSPKSRKPLSMSCYDKLFATSRIPDFNDKTYNPIKIQQNGKDEASRHIIVISNNQYYCLEVLAPGENLSVSSNIWFNDHELSLVLQGIIDHSMSKNLAESVNASIGSITTQSFTDWKLGIEELNKSNSKCMELINSAIFVTVLDSSVPSTDQDKIRVIAHGTSVLDPATNLQIGTCTSRWYDKLQLIVTANSTAGLVWDSTIMDSTAVLRFISDIYTDSVLKLAKDINGSEYSLFDREISFVSGSIDKPSYQLLDINVTRELARFIHLSETRLADLIHQHENRVTSFKLNTYLISKFGLSIDSVLQIAFQIANYTLYGRMANTIEPVTTRKFKDARTELITVQNESVYQLVRLFISSSDTNIRWEQFRETCELHKKQYIDAMNGKGFERHLTTITYVFKKQSAIDHLNSLNSNVEGLPPIPNLLELKCIDIPFISNPVIEKISDPELLISNCGNQAVRFFGIFPATEQGFGIGYVIHGDKVMITVASKYRQTERFLDTFKQIIKDFRIMMVKKSDFLINISDSESRKLELQRLRVEQELKHVDLSSPMTRHPIKLSLMQGTEGSHEVLSDNSNVSRSGSSSSDSKNDFDLLGGYGYFSFGDLESRSETISRNESYLNSVTHSSHVSRLHSSTNLHKSVLEHANMNELNKRLSLSADIRDRLLHSEDLSFSDLSPTVSNSADQGKRKQIGRKLELSDM